MASLLFFIYIMQNVLLYNNNNDEDFERERGVGSDFVFECLLGEEYVISNDYDKDSQKQMVKGSVWM